jgi:hypothetical protein
MWDEIWDSAVIAPQHELVAPEAAQEDSPFAPPPETTDSDESENGDDPYCLILDPAFEAEAWADYQAACAAEAAEAARAKAAQIDTPSTAPANVAQQQLVAPEAAQEVSPFAPPQETTDSDESENGDDPYHLNLDPAFEAQCWEEYLAQCAAEAAEAARAKADQLDAPSTPPAAAPAELVLASATVPEQQSVAPEAAQEDSPFVPPLETTDSADDSEADNGAVQLDAPSPPPGAVPSMLMFAAVCATLPPPTATAPQAQKRFADPLPKEPVAVKRSSRIALRGEKEKERQEERRQRDEESRAFQERKKQERRQRKERKARELRERQRLLCPLSVLIQLQRVVVPEAAPKDAPVAPPPADPAAQMNNQADFGVIQLDAPAHLPCHGTAPPTASTTRSGRVSMKTRKELERKHEEQLRVAFEERRKRERKARREQKALEQQQLHQIQRMDVPEAAPGDAPLAPPPAVPAAAASSVLMLSAGLCAVLPSSPPAPADSTRSPSRRIATKAERVQERVQNERQNAQQRLERLEKKKEERRARKAEKDRERQDLLHPINPVQLQQVDVPEAAPGDAPLAPPSDVTEEPAWMRFELLPQTVVGSRRSPRDLKITNGRIAYCRRGWPHVW